MMWDRDEATRNLAERHYLMADAIRAIYEVCLPEEQDLELDEPIKLLIVNELTPPGDVMPLWFGPAPKVGINFASILIEVTPEEFDQLRVGDRELGQGWRIGGLIPRAVAAASA